MSPHTIYVQTDVLSPQCISENTEAEFLLKDKATLPTQRVTFLCSHPFVFEKSFMTGLLSSLCQHLVCFKFLLALLEFWWVYHTVIWTEWNQLLLLFSFLFAVTVNTADIFSSSPHQILLKLPRDQKIQKWKECSCLSAFVSFWQTD